MERILLLEPNYNCKYPPLGLMKIAYYHKEIKDDFVWFAKGHIPEKVTANVKSKLRKSKYYLSKTSNEIDNFISGVDGHLSKKVWDRVYISTLFTYEWDITIKTIEYAKSLVDDINNIYIGGILASLMPDEIEKATGIKPHIGQLQNTSSIKYLDNINIDKLTPDYSILDNIDYSYQQSNAYYAYTTRGCGMNCDFCAVKSLEPKYEMFISIKEQINEINEKYGEKKDLLLMDNNVLISPKFESIINEIVELGFGKGATYLNPETGKINQRHVDFNQGLDANLFTDAKAELIGKLAIRPARIAFDHIEDAESYLKALDNAAKYDITYLSNYILYNGDAFTGKGKSYKADTPQDLYQRLLINMKYCNDMNIKRQSENRESLKIFSFPMRYIPLEDRKRGYVGANWNEKYLRAVQAILIPTQGKGVSGESFFYAAFGENVDEFSEVILMPEAYIVTRGKPSKVKKASAIDDNRKYYEFNNYENLRDSWKCIYRSLNSDEKLLFLNTIKENKFTFDEFINLTNKKIQKLYLHYFQEFSILNLLETLELQMETDKLMLTINYIANESPSMLERIVRHVYDVQTSSKQLSQLKSYFGEKVIELLITIWKENRFEKISDNCKIYDLIDVFNYRLTQAHLNLFSWCMELKLISQQDQEIAYKSMKNLDIEKLEEILLPHFEVVFKKLKKFFKDIGSEDIEKDLLDVKEQLTQQLSFI